MAKIMIPSVSQGIAVELVARFAEGLHGSGCSAHRLEESVARVALAHGLTADVLALPTAVLVSLNDGEITRLLRRPPGRFFMQRQTELFRFAEQVSSEPSTAFDSLGRLEAILAAPAPYSRVTRVLSSTVAGAVFSVFLQGGWREALIGAAVGLTSGSVLALTDRFHRLERMPELMASLEAAVVAGALAHLLRCSVLIGILGGLLLLLPGMNFTVAVAEMANRALLAGTVRMASSAWTLVGMAFGAALGSAIPTILGPLTPATPETLGIWATVICIPLAGLVLAIHIQAGLREVPWIIGSCAIALGVSRAGVYLPIDWMGNFLGALSVGVYANICSRGRSVPSSALVVAGIYLLVPGSLGYRGLLALASGDTDKGIQLGLNMALRGIALVSGLLFANLVLPPPAPATRREGTAHNLWHSERL